MSYDVSIGSWSGNCTYNVSALFYDHISAEGEKGGINALAGLTGKAAGDKIAAAFERINLTRHRLYVEGAIGEPSFCAKYDPKNGWGSAVGGLIFLAEIMAACYQNPRKRVKVC